MTFPLQTLARACVAALSALIGIEVLWELWLAPLARGSGWLAIKVLPLAFLWRGVAEGRLRALQWTLLLLPWYFAEALVRAWSENGRGAACAVASAVLSIIALVSGLAWARSMRRVGATASSRGA